jgi:hypothetical protein
MYQMHKFFLVTLALVARSWAMPTMKTATMVYDAAEANRTVWLSAAAYCPKETFSSREFLGMTYYVILLNVVYVIAF